MSSFASDSQSLLWDPDAGTLFLLLTITWAILLVVFIAIAHYPRPRASTYLYQPIHDSDEFEYSFDESDAKDECEPFIVQEYHYNTDTLTVTLTPATPKKPKKSRYSDRGLRLDEDAKRRTHSILVTSCPPPSKISDIELSKETRSILGPRSTNIDSNRTALTQRESGEKASARGKRVDYV